MAIKDILSGLFAFATGLLAKFIYDLWQERRHKKSVIFSKKVISSFSVGLLSENIRKRIQVLFDGSMINSVQIIRLSVENNGPTAVKNQAFTVRFSEKAIILGSPFTESSLEDLRYINASPADTPNVYRFTMKLLQTKRKLSWDFSVINNEPGFVKIDPGIISQKDDYSDTDLDVSFNLTQGRAEADLISQLKTTLIMLAFFVAMIILVQPIAVLFGEKFSILPALVLLALLYPLSNSISKLVQLYLENRKSQAESEGNSTISINGNVTSNPGAPVFIMQSRAFGDIVGGSQYDIEQVTPAQPIDTQMIDASLKPAGLLETDVISRQDGEKESE